VGVGHAVLGTFTASAIRTRKDEYGSATTNFRLKSTFERDIRDARAVAIYYNGNKIIGGAYTFVEFVPAGGSTGVQIDAASAPSPPITKTAIYAAPSSLSTLTP
jgi:hypothetical protein